jgi:hypothetical protein
MKSIIKESLPGDFHVQEHQNLQLKNPTQEIDQLFTPAVFLFRPAMN